MAKEKNDQKRGRGRPPGRDYTHIARIPLRPETWQDLSEVAEEAGESAAARVRRLIDEDLKKADR